MKREDKQYPSKFKKAIRAVGVFLNRNMPYIAMCMLMVGMTCSSVFASGGVDPLWKYVLVRIYKWVTRLGGVIMFVGAVNFGLGFSEDAPDKKQRGGSIIVAGALVIAIANMAAHIS